jgi:hypothetical protein
MKVTLLKDVLTPDNGVGRIGQTVEMNAALAHEYLKLGFATEAAEGAEALAPEQKPAPQGPLTHETLKASKKKPATDTSSPS